MSFDSAMSADDFLYLIENENVTAIEDLIAVGFEPDRRLAGGLSFLMLAAATGFPESSRALIAGGANVNHQDDKGNTPLMYVAQNKGNITCLNLLLENGADPLLKNNDGKTALDLAQEKGLDVAAIALRAAEAAHIGQPHSPDTPAPEDPAQKAAAITTRQNLAALKAKAPRFKL